MELTLPHKTSYYKTGWNLWLKREMFDSDIWLKLKETVPACQKYASDIISYLQNRRQEQRHSWKKEMQTRCLAPPVELFLKQVQTRLQLVALLSAQAMQRCVGRWGGVQAAAGDLLVLTTSSALSPETKDVGHPWESSWMRGGRTIPAVFLYLIFARGSCSVWHYINKVEVK